MKLLLFKNTISLMPVFLGCMQIFFLSLVMVLIMSNTNRVDLPGMCFVLMISESWIKDKKDRMLCKNINVCQLSRPSELLASD